MKLEKRETKTIHVSIAVVLGTGKVLVTLYDNYLVKMENVTEFLVENMKTQSY